MTTADITNAVTEVQDAGDLILAEIEALDPAVAVPAAVAGNVLDLVSNMVNKALAALNAAQGVAIDAVSIATLAPDSTPLTPPTA